MQNKKNALVKKIEFFKHNLNSLDKKGCLSVLDSYFLTTGKTVALFEEKLAKYLSAPYAIGVSSCTDALFLTLKYCNISEGNEVITTPLSFIATANVIEYTGAKPVFVDVEASTGNINADLIEQAITKKTKAIIAVHLYGQMCNMRKIRKIADRYDLALIEDAAHCIEGTRDGIKPGQLGDFACFSFYATKTITSGEGGAIVCKDAKAAQWLKKARLHGMSKNAADRYTMRYEHYDMEFLGYKSNMTNIQAALLIHQLDRIGTFLDAKEKIVKQYHKAFSRNSKISTPLVLQNSKHARYIYTIWVDEKKRDSYIAHLQDAGIGVAVNFRPIHLMSYYQEKYGYKKGDYPIAEKIGNATITLPLYPKLTSSEIKYIINAVQAITRE